MLLRCGASVNLSGPKGITPLMIAVQKKTNMGLVETLVDYEADIKATDAKGWDSRRYLDTILSILTIWPIIIFVCFSDMPRKMVNLRSSICWRRP